MARAKQHPGQIDADTSRALLHLGFVGILLLAFGLLAQLLPSGLVVGGVEVPVDRLKLLAPGDPIPLVGLYAQAAGREVPAFAGAGGSYQAAPQDRAKVSKSLGSAVASNLGEVEAGPPAPPEPDHSSPAVRIAPREYEGIEVELENPAALSVFFDALKKTANHQQGAVTRVGHYGDSSIATDLITYTVRRRLQRRFGDAGHGFHLIARGTMPYAHRDVVHRASDAWELRQIVADQDREGLYGYGGVQYRPQTGAFALFETSDSAPVGGSVSVFEVLYRRDPRGGRVRYRVDGGGYETFETRGADGDGVHRIEVADGPHRLELQPAGGGPVRLYGVVLERGGPGVVYDSLGLVGARARRMLNFEPDHIRAQMDQRDLDLLVLGFGGNEADDALRRTEERYEEEFVQVLRRMKAGRAEMACLVFAPLDQAARDRYGRIATMPTIPVIVEAQRNAARREGCAFFDTFKAMGGEGAMAEWARARPRLALSDYRHATPAGYEVIGNLFYKALLKAFAEHLSP